MYLTYARLPSSDVALLVETAGEPAALAAVARALVREASPGTREFGIRLSLGARPAGILNLVLRHGLVIALAGGAAGIPGALVAAGLVRGFLHGVSPLDPRVLVASAASAVLMGLLASTSPALRALRTDPARVLRLE